jgi:hypothetical protein
MAMTMATVMTWKDALKVPLVIALVMATAAKRLGWAMATVMALTNTGAVTSHATAMTMVTVWKMVDVARTNCKTVPILTVVLPRG